MCVTQDLISSEGKLASPSCLCNGCPSKKVGDTGANVHRERLFKTTMH